MDDLKNALHRAGRGIAPPEPAFERLVERRRRKQRNGRITSVATAFVVVAIGVTAAVIAFRPSSSAHRTPSDRGNSSSSKLAAAPGQYYYSRTEIYFAGSSPPTSQVVGPWTLSIWFGRDGSGRSVFSDPTNKPDQPSTTYGWRGGPDETYGPGKFPLENLSSLPTDPDQLFTRLVQRSSDGGASPNPIPTTSPGRSQQDTSLLRTLQDLFNGDELFTPPDVRAAMFEVAGGVTGVETIENAVDPVSRPAIALKWEIFYQAPPSYVEWFFDPDTHQLMAMTWMQEGKVLEARVVTEAGIADSTQEPPGSADQFFPAAERSPDFTGG